MNTTNDKSTSDTSQHEEHNDHSAILFSNIEQFTKTTNDSVS